MDLDTFTEEIFNGKLHFCTVIQHDNRIGSKLECSTFKSDSLHVGLLIFVDNKRHKWKSYFLFIYLFAYLFIYLFIYLFEFPIFIDFRKYFECIFEILRQKGVLNNKMDTFHVFATSLQRKVFSFEFVV